MAEASKGSIGEKRTTLVLEGVFLFAGITILLGALLVYLLAPRERPARLESEGIGPMATLAFENTLGPETRTSIDIPPTYAAPVGQVSTTFVAPSFAGPVRADRGQQANIGLAGSQPVRLVIPALGVDAPVDPVGVTGQSYDDRYYALWIVPDRYAAGWHVSSAPLGQPGNTVLNGHNNVHGAIFRDLAELSAGDEIILYDAERAHRYEVSERILLEERGQSLQIRSQNARFMLPTADERVTLVSCWPKVGSTHRLIVIARPADIDG